jgi:hypothetical protein
LSKIFIVPAVIDSELAAPIAVMHEAAAMDRTAHASFAQEHRAQTRMCRSRHTPTDDAPGVGIDDKSASVFSPWIVSYGGIWVTP